jgi:hypothetical protein
MLHFTLDDLADFTKNEEQMVNNLFAAQERELEFGPSQHSVDRILDYSRAYSVRRSERIQFVRMVLN